MCGNPNPDTSFDRRFWSKMDPHFRLEAIPKMIIEKFSRKCHQFRVHKIDDWFCGTKTFVFGSQKRSIRDGLMTSFYGLRSHIWGWFCKGLFLTRHIWQVHGNLGVPNSKKLAKHFFLEFSLPLSWQVYGKWYLIVATWCLICNFSPTRPTQGSKNRRPARDSHEPLQ